MMVVIRCMVFEGKVWEILLGKVIDRHVVDQAAGDGDGSDGKDNANNNNNNNNSSSNNNGFQLTGVLDGFKTVYDSCQQKLADQHDATLQWMMDEKQREFDRYSRITADLMRSQSETNYEMMKSQVKLLQRGTKSNQEFTIRAIQAANPAAPAVPAGVVLTADNVMQLMLNLKK